MRSVAKVASVSILTLALLLVVAAPSSGQRFRGRPGPRARPHGRVFVNVGPFWGRPHPGFVYAPAPIIVQPSPIFVQQQPVIVQQPSVVVQQPPVVMEQPPPAAASAGVAAAPSHNYWYFCLSAEAYYPTVSSCPEAWIMVPAHPG